MNKSVEEQVKIICIFGLPGTGKTTFARLLAHRLGYRHLNTDIIRTMMGKRAQYDPNTKEEIYDLLLERADQEVRNGRSVIIDGTFSADAYREKLVERAKNTHVGLFWIRICADPEVVRKRVSRKRKYSEADYEVYKAIKATFDPVAFNHLEIHSGKENAEEMVTRAKDYINQ